MPKALTLDTRPLTTDELEIRREWKADRPAWRYLISEGCLGCGAKLTASTAVCKWWEVEGGNAKVLTCPHCSDAADSADSAGDDDVTWKIVWNHLDDAAWGRPAEWKERLMVHEEPEMLSPFEILQRQNERLEERVRILEERLAYLPERAPYTAPRVRPAWLKVDETE